LIATVVGKMVREFLPLSKDLRSVTQREAPNHVVRHEGQRGLPPLFAIYWGVLFFCFCFLQIGLPSGFFGAWVAIAQETPSKETPFKGTPAQEISSQEISSQEAPSQERVTPLSREADEPLLRAGVTTSAQVASTAPSKETASAPASSAENASSGSYLAPPGPGAVPISPKILRYATWRVRSRDANQDGLINPEEWPIEAEQWRAIDSDKSGSIGVEEFANWVARYAQRRRIRLVAPSVNLPQFPMLVPPEAVGGGEGASRGTGTPAEPPIGGNTSARQAAGQSSSGTGSSGSGLPTLRGKQIPRRNPKFYVPPEQLPEGLPRWFLEADQDGDRQVTLAEFAPQPTGSQLRQFMQFDRDSDGLITPEECLAGPREIEAPISRENATNGSAEPEAKQNVDHSDARSVGPPNPPLNAN